MTKLVSKSQRECPHTPSGVTPSSFIYSCLQRHSQINNCSESEPLWEADATAKAWADHHEMHDQTRRLANVHVNGDANSTSISHLVHNFLPDKCAHSALHRAS